MISMINHEYTDNIVCPYCGYTFEDSWEFDGECDNEDCPECEKAFSWSRSVTIDYSTTKLCKENGKEHDFSEWLYHESWTSMGKQYSEFYARHCKECNHVETTHEKPKNWNGE